MPALDISLINFVNSRSQGQAKMDLDPYCLKTYFYSYKTYFLENNYLEKKSPQDNNNPEFKV